jgi:flagellar biosynthesis component FlhA
MAKKGIPALSFLYVSFLLAILSLYISQHSIQQKKKKKLTRKKNSQVPHDCRAPRVHGSHRLLQDYDPTAYASPTEHAEI